MFLFLPVVYEVLLCVNKLIENDSDTHQLLPEAKTFME